MTLLQGLWHDGGVSGKAVRQARLTERKENVMNKRWVAWLCLAICLPGMALCENVVEILPTAAPMPKLVLEENPYAFEDMSAMYGEEWIYQTPALTDTEIERVQAAQERYDAGERAEKNILNLTERIVTALIELPMEQYEGERWFLFLPNRELTDEEALEIVSAYNELAVRFEPEMLTWRNCMRGGFVERERYSAIGSQFTRSGLRPETPFTLIVKDDGIGVVELDEEAYNGLDGFRFYPARRMTDEELLQLYAFTHDEPAVSASEMSAYENQLRKELHDLMGMPLSAKHDDWERVVRADFGSVFGDQRMAYYTTFEEVGGQGRTWSGYLAIETGTLIWASLTRDSSYLTMDSDIRMDPWDGHWTELARDTVASLRADGGEGITDAMAMCESNLNSLYCALVRVITAEGVYQAKAAYVTDEVAYISYSDNISIALEDAYYKEQLWKMEVPFNE